MKKTEISTIEISERKDECQNFFTPYRMRKCLKNMRILQIKCLNHEVTDFWDCKKWIRTVLTFLSLKNRMKGLNFELFRYKMFAFLLALKRSEKAPLHFSQAEKAETSWFDHFSSQVNKCLKHTKSTKCSNHEDSDFWAFEMWTRTVLSFVSLQKMEFKLLHAANMK